MQASQIYPDIFFSLHVYNLYNAYMIVNVFGGYIKNLDLTQILVLVVASVIVDLVASVKALIWLAPLYSK